jgi:hypothetical protein
MCSGTPLAPFRAAGFRQFLHDHHDGVERHGRQSCGHQCSFNRYPGGKVVEMLLVDVRPENPIAAQGGQRERDQQQQGGAPRERPVPSQSGPLARRIRMAGGADIAR